MIALIKKHNLPYKLTLDNATLSLASVQRVKEVDFEKVPEECVVKSVTMASIRAWQKELGRDEVPQGVTFESQEQLRITFAK